jgi:RNase P subunit RPR2
MTDKKNVFDANKVQEWLKTKWVSRVCECCGKNDRWTVARDLTSTPIFNQGILLGGPTYIYVIATCGNCGNTKFFNAVLMGLLDKSKEDNNG